MFKLKKKVIIFSATNVVRGSRFIFKPFRKKKVYICRSNHAYINMDGVFTFRLKRKKDIDTLIVDLCVYVDK